MRDFTSHSRKGTAHVGDPSQQSREDQHVDEITAPTVRAFMAVLGKRGIQSRAPLNLLRTLLTAAVEIGALEAMPDLPKAPSPGRKLPSAPSTDEVNAVLANATGWLSVAVALWARLLG